MGSPLSAVRMGRARGNSRDLKMVKTMDRKEVIKRLKRIAEHAIYTVEEPPFVMSLDDGIAVNTAIDELEGIELMKEKVVGSVVQFTEGHKWYGCLGIIVEDKGYHHPRRYMIEVPVPQQGSAYIFDDGNGIEWVGFTWEDEGEA